MFPLSTSSIDGLKWGVDLHVGSVITCVRISVECDSHSMWTHRNIAQFCMMTLRAKWTSMGSDILPLSWVKWLMKSLPRMWLYWLPLLLPFPSHTQLSLIVFPIYLHFIFTATDDQSLENQPYRGGDRPLTPTLAHDLTRYHQAILRKCCWSCQCSLRLSRFAKFYLCSH